MSAIPSAPPLGNDNFGLDIDDEDFDIYDQSIYNDTDSAKIARCGYHNPPQPHFMQGPTSPGSPTSEQTFQRSFSVRSKHSNSSHYTRQINMSIGEEWENVHQVYDPSRKALTCPPTPRRYQIYTTQPLSPWAEKPEKVSEQIPDEPLTYFFNRLTEEERGSTKDYAIEPNPHNKCNHKLHSVLHCPCFFFFCLLCCLPGVHYMERSDEEYRTGHEDRAKSDGKLATLLYILGFVAASAFLSGLVYFSVSFVHGQIKS